ncbi:MAG TPA: hypothetical protein VFH61_11170 [Thermoleophilia bacterium]|nr:hypothetical protein [Thermoleophilia bacterium]
MTTCACCDAPITDAGDDFVIDPDEPDEFHVCAACMSEALGAGDLDLVYLTKKKRAG